MSNSVQPYHWKLLNTKTMSLKYKKNYLYLNQLEASCFFLCGSNPSCLQQSWWWIGVLICVLWIAYRGQKRPAPEFGFTIQHAHSPANAIQTVKHVRCYQASTKSRAYKQYALATRTGSSNSPTKAERAHINMRRTIDIVHLKYSYIWVICGLYCVCICHMREHISLVRVVSDSSKYLNRIQFQMYVNVCILIIQICSESDSVEIIVRSHIQSTCTWRTWRLGVLCPARGATMRAHCSTTYGGMCMAIV